jgi:hypothetical protein
MSWGASVGLGWLNMMIDGAGLQPDRFFGKPAPRRGFAKSYVDEEASAVP